MIKTDLHFDKVIYTEHGEVAFNLAGEGTGDAKAEKLLAGLPGFELVEAKVAEKTPAAPVKKEVEDKVEEKPTPAKRTPKKAPAKDAE